MFKELIREHSMKVAVFGIMAVVSFAVGLAITGDYSSAFGFAHRR